MELDQRGASGHLEDLFMRCIAIVVAVGFGWDAHRCRNLCRETRVVDQRGAVADMIEGGLRVHGVSSALAKARAEPRALLGYGKGNWSGTSQLQRAAIDGDALAVRRLLALGASVNAASGAGVTALACACSYGRVDIARLLLEAGAKNETPRTRVTSLASW
jgi:hypothetical protein